MGPSHFTVCRRLSAFTSEIRSTGWETPRPDRLGAGGAIYVHGGTLVVRSSTFEGNGAVGGDGAAKPGEVAEGAVGSPDGVARALALSTFPETVRVAVVVARAGSAVR